MSKAKVTDIDPVREQVYGIGQGDSLLKIIHSCDDCEIYHTQETVLDGVNFREVKSFQCLGCGSIMRQKLVWGDLIVAESKEEMSVDIKPGQPVPERSKVEQPKEVTANVD